MDSYLVLNSWAGDDPQKAASRLAQMFRMAEDQASKIVENLRAGRSWQIPKRLSDQKAQVAKTYLKNLGFGVAPAGEAAVAVGAREPSIEQSSAGTNHQKSGSALARGTTAIAPSRALAGNERTVQFHGDGWNLAKIMSVNWILAVITLGVYYFWGKTKIRRYLFEQSSFAGDRFSYHGTGGELFRGWLFFILLVMVFVGGSIAIQQFLGPVVQSILETTIGILFVLLLPALLVGAYRYRLSRSAWRGIRFSFRGTRKEAIWVYLKGYFLIMVTLGIYSPWFQMNTQKFWSGNSYFGDQSFKFTGQGDEIFKQFIINMILLFPTLGLYSIWYKAYVARYTWSHTHFAGGTFRFTATGWETFQLLFTNLLLLVGTVGLAYSWVTVRSRKFVADHLSLAGEVDLDRVVQEIKQSGTLGEGALEAFDLPLDII